MPPHVHFLTFNQKKGKGGLITISELPKSFTGPTGCFFIPVQDDDSLFDEYLFDVHKYKGQGEWEVMDTITLKREDENLVVDFANRKLVFKPNFTPGQAYWTYKGSLFLPYTGKVKHPDFKHRFIRLDAPDKEFDEIYNETGCIFIGYKE